MWLEEFVWAWLPVVAGLGVWGIRDYLRLKAEVQTLRTRIEHLEAEHNRVQLKAA